MTIPAGFGSGDVQTGPGLVSVDELLEYLDKSNVPATKRAKVGKVLFGVQQELENHLNRPLQPMHVRETVTSDALGYSRLSVTPVHKVISIVEASLTEPTTDEPLIAPIMPEGVDRQIDYTVGHLDANNRPGGFFFGASDTRYVIEYIGGWIGYVPEGLKQDIKRVAAREARMMLDDTMSLRGDRAEATESPDPRDLGWTENELRKWDRLRRRVIV
jgi:hypothetical protein